MAKLARGIWGFARYPLPKAGAPIWRTNAVLLKILAWVMLVSTFLTAAFFLFIALAAVFFGALLVDLLNAIGSDAPATDSVGRIGFVIALFIAIGFVIAALVVTAIGLVVTYLISKCYIGLVRRDPGWGVVGVRITTGILCLLSLLQMADDLFLGRTSWTAVPTVITILLCIAIFALSFGQSVKAEFAKGVLPDPAVPPPVYVPEVPTTPSFAAAGTAPTRASGPLKRWTCPRCRRLYNLAVVPPSGTLCEGCKASPSPA